MGEKGNEEHPRRGRRQKVSRGAKGAEKVAGRAHGGNGRVPGLCGHLGSPQAGSCPSFSAPWGSPLPEPGGQREEVVPQSPAPHSTGGVGHKELPAAPGGSPGWVLLCFVPGWELLGAVSGVRSSTWELKTANGDTRMESPSCGSTPGEGGEMDGEGKQNQTSMILCVNDYLICGSGFW